MIVFLTALDFEGEAVRAHLAGLQTHHHPAGTVFEVGHLAGRPDCAVALAVIGMGTVNAAAITERAIAEFRPTAVVFVGIAGGLREWIALGDVVVATRVYAFHGGRVDEDVFLARPRAWDTSHRLVQLAKFVNRSKAWPGATENSAAVHFEPVAAGEIVLNSSTGPDSDRLHAHYNDAVAIEMESAGVALAGQLYESTPTIAVRGISDRADGDKQGADAAGWQPIAVRNAASFAVGLVAAIHETEKADMTTNESPQPTPLEQQESLSQLPAHLPSNHVAAEHKGTSVGNITAGGPVDLNRVDIAGRDLHKTRNTRIGTGGIAGAIIAAVLALGAGTAGVVAVTSDNSPPAPETIGTASTTDGITESVRAFTGAVAAEDYTRACAFVNSHWTDYDPTKCVEKLKAGDIFGKDTTDLIKKLDRYQFITSLKTFETTYGYAKYAGDLYFEMAYALGRWYITDLNT